MVLQELIEAEAAEVIGAGRYERTTSRTTTRNGHRDRPLSTLWGSITWLCGLTSDFRPRARTR
jgi:transposase-like protein